MALHPLTLGFGSGARLPSLESFGDYVLQLRMSYLAADTLFLTSEQFR
jgi:hypothetical protein